jgi:diguanylate cyclase (GGDEF)-like protein
LPPDRSGAALAAADLSQVSAPQVTTVRTRRAAGFLAFIPAALLFTLFLYWRRPYIAAWIVDWLLLAVMLYVTTIGTDLMHAGRRELAGMLVGAARSLGVIGILLLWLGARWFRGRVQVPRTFVFAGAALCLWLIASAQLAGVSTTLVSSYTALGVLHVAGGVAYLRLRRRFPFAGPIVVGVGMIGAAATYVYAVAVVLTGAGGMEPPNTAALVNIVWSGVIALGMHLLVFEDMSAELQATNASLAKAERELSVAAVTDPLTGCYNRRFFDEVIERELDRHWHHELPLTLLFIDCNRLKHVNDRFGHSTGDAVLTSVANVIRSHVRVTDYVFRWGGDEFLVLLTCDEAQAELKAAAMQDAFTHLWHNRTVGDGGGLSSGWVAVPSGTRNVLPFIEQADERMYANKRANV